MTHETLYYEITVSLITLPILAFFLFLLHEEHPDRKSETIYQLTVAFCILWLELTTQIFTEFWETIHFMRFHIPPLHIILEVSLVAYLSATLWNIWKKEASIK